MNIDILPIIIAAVKTIVIAQIMTLSMDKAIKLIKKLYWFIVIIIYKVTYGKEYRIIVKTKQYYNKYKLETYKRYKGKKGKRDKEEKQLEILKNKIKAIDDCYMHKFSLDEYLGRINSIKFSENYIFGLLSGIASGLVVAVYLNVIELYTVINSKDIEGLGMIIKLIVMLVVVIVLSILLLIIIMMILYFTYRIFESFDKLKPILNKHEEEKIKAILLIEYKLNIDEGKLIENEN